MTNATITTTGTLTTLAIGNGRAINIPARVPGVSMTSEQALENALEYTSASDIHAYLVECWQDAERVGATDAQVVHHFVAWLASAGDWAE
jgi:hypothetical protein